MTVTQQRGHEEFTHAWNHVGNLLSGRFDSLDTDVTVLKADVSVLKADVSVLKTDVAQLKTDVAELKTDVAELRGQVNRLEESTQHGFNRIEMRLEQLVGLIVKDELRPR